MSPNPNTTPTTSAPQAAAYVEPLLAGLSPELLAAIEETERKLLVKQEIERRQFNQDQRLAAMFFESGYFADVKSLAQAATKIALGQSWNMSAADSLKWIYFVNDRPAVQEEYLASRMRGLGWSWQVQYINRQGPSCAGVRLFISKDGKPYMLPSWNSDGTPKVATDGTQQCEQLNVSMTEEEAKGIKVYQKGAVISLLEKSGPWSMGHRATMYFWRSLSKFRKMYAPEVMTGARTREEAIDLDDLEVSDRGETPLPSQRLPTDEKIDLVIHKTRTKRGSKEEPADAEAETKTPDPETKAAEPETERKTIAPVSADQLKAIRKYEGHLGSDAFYALLSDFDLKRPEQINSFEVAERVLARMAKEHEALQAKSAGKPA